MEADSIAKSKSATLQPIKVPITIPQNILSPLYLLCPQNFFVNAAIKKGRIMNDLSQKILKLLEEDSRYSAAKIADILGASENEVAKLVDEMENGGVIVKYTTVINKEKIVHDVVDALVEVKVTPQARQGFEKIAQEISALKEVKGVYLMSGTFDFAVMLEGTTMRDVALFISERLSTIESVVSVATHFILKKYKEGGAMLADFDDDNDRISVHE